MSASVGNAKVRGTLIGELGAAESVRAGDVVGALELLEGAPAAGAGPQETAISNAKSAAAFNMM